MNVVKSFLAQGTPIKFIEVYFIHVLVENELIPPFIDWKWNQRWHVMASRTNFKAWLRATLTVAPLGGQRGSRSIVLDKDNNSSCRRMECTPHQVFLFAYIHPWETQLLWCRRYGLFVLPILWNWSYSPRPPIDLAGDSHAIRQGESLFRPRCGLLITRHQGCYGCRDQLASSLPRRKSKQQICPYFSCWPVKMGGGHQKCYWRPPWRSRTRDLVLGTRLGRKCWSGLKLCCEI